jgi:hypothetical protein
MTFMGEASVTHPRRRRTLFDSPSTTGADVVRGPFAGLSPSRTIDDEAAPTAFR